MNNILLPGPDGPSAQVSTKAGELHNNQLLLLQVMLKTAIRWRLIRHNPLSEIQRPRLERPDLNILDQTEIAHLWTAYTTLEHDAESDEQQEWWRIAKVITFTALGTAMRRSELLALHWRDVELLEGHLHVRHARVNGRATTPKSAAGRRRIELGPRTRQLLTDHWQTCSYRADDNLVFHHPNKGTPLDPARLAREYLKPALRAAGIDKPFRPFHDLRHTALTHDAAAGNPLTYIQLKAGHSNTQITERYIHAAQIQFDGAAERAEARMFGH